MLKNDFVRTASERTARDIQDLSDEGLLEVLERDICRRTVHLVETFAGLSHAEKALVAVKNALRDSSYFRNRL